MYAFCHLKQYQFNVFFRSIGVCNCVDADAADAVDADVVVVVVVVGITKHNKLHSFIHIRYSSIHNYRNV